MTLALEASAQLLRAQHQAWRSLLSVYPFHRSNGQKRK